jgi:hypothetical protein
MSKCARKPDDLRLKGDRIDGADSLRAGLSLIA